MWSGYTANRSMTPLRTTLNSSTGNVHLTSENLISASDVSAKTLLISSCSGFSSLGFLPLNSMAASSWTSVPYLAPFGQTSSEKVSPSVEKSRSMMSWTPILMRLGLYSGITGFLHRTLDSFSGSNLYSGMMSYASPDSSFMNWE